MHSAKILKDSISEAGYRLTTMEVVFPRIILAEFNTHRMFSRNSASSRAIPIDKLIARVENDPYVPSVWAKNQKGMSSSEELSGLQRDRAEQEWRDAALSAARHASFLAASGMHKQYANRVLEPFLWHTVIVSATEWSNFFHLREHKDAHPEIQIVATLMREAMAKSDPVLLHEDQYHLPFIGLPIASCSPPNGALTTEFLAKVSVGRCARVSYLTHDGRRDSDEDVRLCDQLARSGHMSPFEHVARPMTEGELNLFRRPRLWAKPDSFAQFVGLSDQFDHYCGNFNGWVQYRKLLPKESDPLG